jgi:serine/threonine-protein kinase
LKFVNQGTFMVHSKIPSVVSREEFVQVLGNSGLFSADELRKALAVLPSSAEGGDGLSLARHLTAAGKLTDFQAEALLERKVEELVLGNYEILARLGAGGMGTVFKARHRRMKRVVAIKLMARSIAQDSTFLQRFQREVETVARLSHPNIVMAFDADEAEAGPFLVMEFVNGRDLATRVQELGPLTLREAADCILQAAKGLACAHAQGIVHRDIKPANLLRDEYGVVKVADLGLARLSDAVNPTADKAGSLTQAGSVVGTVDFMAPEQAEDSSTTDSRADIYSLGCTLYFLLTGKPPYVGHSLMATLIKHGTAPIPSLCAARPETPPALDSLLRSMLAKQPRERCSSMTEVVSALESLLPSLPDAPAPQLAATPVASTSSGNAPTMALGGIDQLAGLIAPPTGVIGREARQDNRPSTQIPLLAALSVLLVEPSRTQAVIVRKYLQDLGIENVPTVPSAAKAFESIQAARPQVVISAMHLNDQNGVQFAQKLRSESALANVGFLLVSSEADARDAAILLGYPRTLLLGKPFDLEQLKRALRQVSS